MTTTKPYLIRAIREWAIDNDLTPQILVDAAIAGVHVPRDYVKDGQIVLNIGGQAVQMREMGNEVVSFTARFRGAPFDVEVPVSAVLAIYARENGQGIFFKEPETPPEPDTDGEDKDSRAHLKLVK